MSSDVDQRTQRLFFIGFHPKRKTIQENRNNWSELIWAEQSRRLSVASMSRHSALRDDLRPLNSRPLSTALSPSLSRSVTSTPVRLTLLNKASSKITPSCLSALLRYKSFIKHKGESRSISNHQHWKEICVCVCVRSALSCERLYSWHRFIS